MTRLSWDRLQKSAGKTPSLLARPPRRHFSPCLHFLVAVLATFAWSGLTFAEERPVPTVQDEIVKAAAAAPLAMEFHGSTPADLSAWQTKFTAKLSELIGPHTPPAAFQTEILSRAEFPDYTREELLLTAKGFPTLPLYILRPHGSPGQRFPTILCLHGHGPFGHDAVAGVDETPERAADIHASNYDYGRQLARAGYLTVIPCFTPFGRRLDPKTRSGPSDPCAVEFVRLMFLGRTLLGENLRDAIWALNYALTRPDVAPERIGCVGLSYGGRMTMMVAALDPRIRVAVIAGARNLLQERIAGAGYGCGAQVIPGLLQYGDTPEIASLIAPRPVLWEVGSQDSLLRPPAWTDDAAERLLRGYTASGHPENLQFGLFAGAHVWNEELALPVLAKVLKRTDEHSP